MDDVDFAVGPHLDHKPSGLRVWVAWSDRVPISSPGMNLYFSLGQMVASVPNVRSDGFRALGQMFRTAFDEPGEKYHVDLKCRLEDTESTIVCCSMVFYIKGSSFWLSIGDGLIDVELPLVVEAARSLGAMCGCWADLWDCRFMGN